MTYTYVPGNPDHTSGPNGPVTRIVIHGTCSATKDGGAMANAHYFQQDNAGGLAHYVADPDQIVQCCKEDTACWHAPPNKGSIGIELCDPQGNTKVQANAKDPKRWADPDHEKMLRSAARLVVEVAKRHGVPLVKVSAADLKAGKHGICGHVDVSHAFGQSTHEDPGADFPWAHFMDLVHAAANPAPAAKPATKRTLTLTTPYLHGTDVAEVAQALAKRGYPTSDPVDVFGSVTHESARRFQVKAHAQFQTGDVGVETRRLLGITP